MAGRFFQFDRVGNRSQFARPFEDKPFHPPGHAKTFTAEFRLVRGKSQAPIFSVGIERGLDFRQAFHFHPFARLKVESFGGSGLD